MEKGRQINLDNIAKMFFRLKKNRKGEFSKGKKDKEVVELLKGKKDREGDLYLMQLVKKY